MRQSGLTSIAATAAVLSGLVLDVTIAARYGAGPKTDAFFVAARIPLGIVAIVMVGANQALVPTITTWLVKAGRAETRRLTSLLLTATLGLGVPLAAAAAILAWPLMRVTAPGLSSAEVDLAASMARIMFFVVPLVATAEVLRAFLNARFSFFAPAAMNVVLNGVAAALVIAYANEDPHTIAWAYLAGAAAQTLFMLAMAFARGFRFVPSLHVRDAEVVAAGRLCVRPLIGASLNPVARVGEQLFVSFLPPGSITLLNYGSRLIHAIGGAVLFRSIVVALLPRLTRALASGRLQELREVARLGVRIMLFVSIPLTALMAVLAEPATVALFARGDFTTADATLLGQTLVVYSASLIGSALQRAFLAPFFAAKDTRTPLRNTILGVVVNLALMPFLVLPFGRESPRGILGVAAAYSLAQYANVAHAWRRVRHDFGVRLVGFLPMTIRLVAASALMTVTLLLERWALGLSQPTERWLLLAKTGVAALGGIAVFAGALWAMGSRELRQLPRSMRRGDAHTERDGP